MKKSDVALTIEARHSGGWSALVVSGPLRGPAAGELVERVQSLMTRRGLATLRVDVTRIITVDCFGIDCLVRSRKIAHESGVDFSLSLAYNGAVAREMMVTNSLRGWLAESRVEPSRRRLAANA